MSTAVRDLDAILDTLREVGESLDRRVARAEGANLMVWGLVVASIFTFYQLVAWNPAPYEALFGPLLQWVWLGPLALGYVLSAVIGARLGRVTTDPAARERYKRGLLPAALSTALVTALILLDRGEAIAGAVTALCGATTLWLCFASKPTRLRPWAIAAGAGMLAVGIALVAWPVEWASLAAALAFLIGILGLGTVRYRLGG